MAWADRWRLAMAWAGAMAWADRWRLAMAWAGALAWAVGLARGTQLRALPAGARSGETCRAGTILERGLLRRWWLGVGWFCLTRAKPK